MAVCLVPFNAVIVLIIGLLRSLRRPVPPAGGARIFSKDHELHVLYRRLSPLIMATFLGVSLVGMLVSGFGFEINSPAGACLGVGVVAITLVAYISLRREAEVADLIVDLQRRTLSFREVPPKSLRARREWKRAGRLRLSVPFEEITAVDVRERLTDGGSTHVPVLVVTTSETPAEREYDLGAGSAKGTRRLLRRGCAGRWG